MKKYRVIASYITYCTVDIEAKNMDDAFAIAKSMDGGDFSDDGSWDWNIERIDQLEEEVTP